jgi:serine/threonine-protein kinase
VPPSDIKPRTTGPRPAEPEEATAIGHGPEENTLDDTATRVHDRPSGQRGGSAPRARENDDTEEASIRAFDARLEQYTMAGATPGRTGQPAALVAGRYRLLSSIGEGSMGRIFLAEQVSVGRRVAVKIINRELTAKFDTIARFQQEARLLASVTNEHIVEVYDIGETEGGDPFIAMEYVDGPSLGRIIHDQAPLAPARTLRILLQVASALATVHAAGVVHRDLKPANIVVLTRKDGFEIVKILDFGLAKVVGDREAAGRLTRAGVIIGTPEYMSPEQVTATNVDHRADLYALGCTAYEMLCGRPPFTGPEMSTLYKHMHEEPQSLLDADEPVPEPIAKVVMRCLAKDASQRWQTARELHTALVVAADEAGIARRDLRILRGSLEDPVEVPEVGVPRPAVTTQPMAAPPPPKKRTEVALLAATALVLGLVGGVLVGQRTADPPPARRSAPTAAPTGAAATTGGLVVTTRPASALVAVDGGEARPGPLALVDLRPGKHTVSVSARGWATAEREVEIAPGQSARLEIALERPRYQTVVETEPTSATVTVDGVEAGLTPVGVTLSESEFHEIKLRRDGFREKTVLVAADDRRERIHVVLEPVLLHAGFIVVDSPHPGRVFVDGQDTGEWTPTGELQLPPGRHTVELVDAVGVRRKASVKVTENDVTRLEVPAPSTD